MLLIAVAVFILLEEYLRAGKFQWVDPSSVDDHEVPFLVPIFVTTILFGIISIVRMLAFNNNLTFWSGLKNLLRNIASFLTSIYGGFSLLVGAIFLVAGIANSGIESMTTLPGVLYLTVFATYAVQGYLTLQLLCCRADLSAKKSTHVAIQ